MSRLQVFRGIYAAHIGARLLRGNPRWTPVCYCSTGITPNQDGSVKEEKKQTLQCIKKPAKRAHAVIYFGRRGLDLPNKADAEPNIEKHIWSAFAIFVFCLYYYVQGSLPLTSVEQVESESKEDSKEESKNPLSLNFTVKAESEADGEGEEKKKNKGAGFRDRKVIAYEDKLRSFSTPDKLFRYFATLEVKMPRGTEIFMTPDDFVRSITPGLQQPEGLGLDKFIQFDPKRDHYECKLGTNSIFTKLGESGLISFSDYIFLLTLLAAPQKHFELAFRMFDFNGDGDVDYEEFEKVQAIIRSQTSIGQRHRNTKDSVVKHTSSGLANYFFGKNREKKLTIREFLDFQNELQREILTIEFNRYDPEYGRISEKDFAQILILYAGLSDTRKTKMLKRVRKKFKTDPQGIDYYQYLAFCKFLKHINEVDTALTFYTIAGASIDQATLKHVAKTVAGVDLDNHLVNVVFTLFDENDDGELSNKEFVHVMKQRTMRGLEKSKDTGVVKVISAVFKCAYNQGTALFD